MRLLWCLPAGLFSKLDYFGGRLSETVRPSDLVEYLELARALGILERVILPVSEGLTPIN